MSHSIHDAPVLPRECQALASPALISGTLSATAVTLHYPRSVIGPWLPPGLNLPHADSFPLQVLFGEQSDVTAFAGGRLPFPWRLRYHEIIVVAPDLVLDPPVTEVWSGAVCYLPRLYMNSWKATLLGRGLYGFAKAFARIEETDGRYRAWSRRGRPLLEARTTIRETSQDEKTLVTGYLDQPIAVRAGRGLALLRFDLTEESASPVGAEIELHPDFLINVPETRVAMRNAIKLRARWSLHRCVSEGHAPAKVA